AVGHQQPEFDFPIPGLRLRQVLPNPRAILRMDPLKYRLERRHLARVKSVNPESFVRPEHLSRGDAPAVGADAADPLRFGQERLASPQRLLGALAGGNVDHHPGKETGGAFSLRDERDVDVDPYDRAVLAHVALLDPIAAVWTSDDRVEVLPGGCAIVLVSEIGHRHALQLILGV